MLEIKKLIFGKKYRLTAYAGFENLLNESVKSYCDYLDGSSDVDVFVGGVIDNDDGLISKNPAIFSKYDKSIVTDFGNVVIRWSLSKQPRLTAHLSFPTRSLLKSFLTKILSMEYSSELEIFEQIFHELFLVPSTYFFNELTPIHAAAISIHGKGVLLSGTGGTGKTSALLSLRNEKGISFLSDDINVLSKNGYMYPNLAWPKLYGYNLLDIPNLKYQVLTSRGLLDKMHFNVRAKVNPLKVRRKIPPQDLFQDVNNEGCELSLVYFLFRENIPILSVDELNLEQAVEMSIAVMETEYGVFHRFLHWENFNALASNSISMLDINEVIEKWRFNLQSIFECLPIMLVRIPVDMAHRTYCKEIKSLVLNQSGIND